MFVAVFERRVVEVPGKRGQRIGAQLALEEDLVLELADDGRLQYHRLTAGMRGRCARGRLLWLVCLFEGLFCDII